MTARTTAEQREEALAIAEGRRRCGTCGGEREVCYDPGHGEDDDHECDPETCEDCDGSGEPLAETRKIILALLAQVREAEAERTRQVLLAGIEMARAEKAEAARDEALSNESAAAVELRGALDAIGRVTEEEIEEGLAAETRSPGLLSRALTELRLVNAECDAAWRALGVDPDEPNDDPDVEHLSDAIRVSLQHERDQIDDLHSALAAASADRDRAREALRTAWSDEAEDAREERDVWAAAVAHIGQALGMPEPPSDWRDVKAADVIKAAADTVALRDEWAAASARLSGQVDALRARVRALEEAIKAATIVCETPRSVPAGRGSKLVWCGECGDCRLRALVAGEGTEP